MNITIDRPEQSPLTVVDVSPLTVFSVGDDLYLKLNGANEVVCPVLRLKDWSSTGLRRDIHIDTIVESLRIEVLKEIRGFRPAST